MLYAVGDGTVARSTDAAPLPGQAACVDSVANSLDRYQAYTCSMYSKTNLNRQIHDIMQFVRLGPMSMDLATSYQNAVSLIAAYPIN